MPESEKESVNSAGKTTLTVVITPKPTDILKQPMISMNLSDIVQYPTMVPSTVLPIVSNSSKPTLETTLQAISEELEQTGQPEQDPIEQNQSEQDQSEQDPEQDLEQGSEEDDADEEKEKQVQQTSKPIRRNKSLYLFHFI